MLYRIRPRGCACFIHEIPSSIWDGSPWSTASESSWVMQPPTIVSPVYFIYIDIHTHSHTYIYIYIYLYLYKSHWIDVSIAPEHVPDLVFTGECLFLCHCPELLLVTLYIHADTAKGTGLYRDGWVVWAHRPLERGFGQQGKGSCSGVPRAFPSADLPSCPQKLRGHLRCGRCVRLSMQGLSKETMTIQVSEKPEQNIGFS